MIKERNLCIHRKFAHKRRDKSKSQRLSTLCIPTWPLSPVFAGFFRGDFLLGGIFSFSSLSSFDSSPSTRCGPAPGLESRRTCFLDNTACAVVLPAGGRGCARFNPSVGRPSPSDFTSSVAASSPSTTPSESLLFFSTQLSTPFLVRSYRARTSPPFHVVPIRPSQNVKNGWLKLVLMPQL